MAGSKPDEQEEEEKVETVAVSMRIPKELHRTLQTRVAFGPKTYSQIVIEALERDCARFPDLLKELDKIADMVLKVDQE